MNIKEILIHKIIDSKIFEMAFERKKATQYIEGDTRFEIAEHLIKILMYSEYQQNVEDWTDELNNKWLSRIRGIKLKSGSWFSKEYFYNVLWDEPLGTIADVQEIMNRISNQMPKFKISQPDARVIHKHAMNVMNKVSESLANKTFTDIRNYLHVV